ncbi:hypothetical protein BGZ93_003963, partial [Podila epicladia]
MPNSTSSVISGSQSPSHFNEADDTCNYSQFQREPSLPTGDIFFLSIMSPLSWVDDVGEQSFIHNPEDGPYTPVHSSTPLIHTGEDVSDGHQTPRQNSPYSRSRSPPHSQRGSRSLRHPTRSPSPAHISSHHSPSSMPSQGAPSKGLTMQHVLLSLEMAEAQQGNWSGLAQDQRLSFQERNEAHTNFLHSNRLVRYYTVALQELEAFER